MSSNSSDAESDWCLHLWQLPMSSQAELSATYKAAQMRYITAKYGYRYLLIHVIFLYKTSYLE